MEGLSPDARALLDGLEVGSISELRALVDRARAGVVVSPNQIRALHSFWAEGRTQGDVRLRPAERNGYFVGAVHAEPLDENDHRSTVFSYDVTREGGNLGISYDTLVSLPARIEET